MHVEIINNKNVNQMTEFVKIVNVLCIIGLFSMQVLFILFQKLPNSLSSLNKEHKTNPI